MTKQSAIKDNEVAKTKKEIEAAHPFVDPKDCPGAVMDWVVGRDDKQFDRFEELLEATFTKHFKKYVNMIYGHRLWLVGLSTIVGLVIVVLWIHIKMVT